MAENSRSVRNLADDLDDGDRPRQRRGGRSGGSDGGRKSSYQNKAASSQQYGNNNPRRRYTRRRVCIFCVDKNATIDWKQVDGLRRFVADNGAIYPRRKSGLCAKHQRGIAVAIKRARHIALLPYTTEHIRIMGKS
jgi:small subunit ribosomal protein S18